MALFYALLFALVFLIRYSAGQLKIGFYSETCPEAESTVSSVVQDAVVSDPNLAAVLLRLHFHDCFVNVINHARIHNLH